MSSNPVRYFGIKHTHIHIEWFDWIEPMIKWLNLTPILASTKKILSTSSFIWRYGMNEWVNEIEWQWRRNKSISDWANWTHDLYAYVLIPLGFSGYVATPRRKLPETKKFKSKIESNFFEFFKEISPKRFHQMKFHMNASFHRFTSKFNRKL